MLEWVIGIAAVLVIAAIVLPLLVTVGAGAAAVAKVESDAAKREQAESQADQLLAQHFDGERISVVYDTRPSGALRPSAAIAGAMERGYELVHDDAGVLTFRRA